MVLVPSKLFMLKTIKRGRAGSRSKRLPYQHCHSCKATDEQSALIDKFIAEEPRSFRQRPSSLTPLYRPNEALRNTKTLFLDTWHLRRSGGLLKARSAYQRLGLLHPEKRLTLPPLSAK